MTNAQIEMKLHALSDKISQLEERVQRALALIEEMNKPIETTPIDRNYRGWK